VIAVSIRFTNDILSRQTLFDLEHITEKLSKTQAQLSSGKRITAPEDDPYGSGRAVALRNDLADVQQYQVNIHDASAWTQTTDSALGNVTNLLQRARELTVEAANGTQNADSRMAISAEMTQIKASLQAQANSTYNGRYIFSGTATDVAPYPTNSYAGTLLPVQRLIAPGEIVKVNIDGPAAFGTTAAGPPATKSVFDVMDSIIADLNAGNSGALQTTALTDLDASFTTALNARTTVGALSNRLETQANRLSVQELSVTDLLSKTEDADMAKTLISYSQTQTAYQAALQAGAKIIQPTLMDFLR
jgi:flagellar hook-associated protein 3 FlgL